MQGSPRIFLGVDRDQYWIGSIGHVSAFAFGLCFGDFAGPELSRTRPLKLGTRPVAGCFRVIAKRALEKYPEQSHRVNGGTYRR